MVREGPEGIQEDTAMPPLVSRAKQGLYFLHFYNSLVTIAKCFLMLEFYIKMQQEGWKEMTLWLRAVTALAEDPGLVPRFNIHVVAHNLLLTPVPGHLIPLLTYMHHGAQIYTKFKYKNIFKRNKYSFRGK